jgi:hypothetical protein
MGQTKERMFGGGEVRFRLGKTSAFFLAVPKYEDDFVCGHFSDTSFCCWEVKGGEGVHCWLILPG